ncbi:phosphatase PAP2 family protein [Trichlorobacter lovleyi]|uniref:phosphatase PAP2 family protein n=1 Tax=Trichlorobacter lovleyi TaxID=313985 RepID=UPI002240A443|nr:phosphatase PAP2 family protein [Trichlorobacter lovleyi]QOX80213.1 phosphatase PAP2 family protein [Trichlorobacter lovleyi]
MNHSRVWREVWLVLAVLVAGTALIAATGADLTVASHFYRSGGWPTGEQFPWKLLYRLDRYPALAVAIFGLFAACYSYYRPDWRVWRRQGAFLVLLLALGPGLLVNATFKDHWGRPRPRELVQFGGTKAFMQPWQPRINGDGRSFPCGHGSAAFYLAAPYFIYRRRKPRVAQRWLFGGMTFGLLMSYARLAQGGHFLSDILWAWGIVWLSALALAAFLLPDQESETNSCCALQQ